MNERNRWINFAREGQRAAQIMYKEGIWTLSCFHSQQAVEKALKGFLKEKIHTVSKTHSLIELLNICLQEHADFSSIQEDCAALNRYYVPTRYPDTLPGSLPEGLPTREHADKALQALARVMDFISKKT